MTPYQRSAVNRFMICVGVAGIRPVLERRNPWTSCTRWLEDGTLMPRSRLYWTMYKLGFAQAL